MADSMQVDACGEAYAKFLASRRRELLERIERAANRAGRNPMDVELLAVSKTVGFEEVREAYRCGYRLFGENRPQELKRKMESVRCDGTLEDVRFDMIGNLQKNKINQVLGNATLVHSVSSAGLAQAISRRAEQRGVDVRCLLEVNVSGEQTKSGFSPDAVYACIENLLDLPGMTIEGLMTMAPAGDPSAARASFCGLREVRDAIVERTGWQLPVLSCGMSDDFEIAVEEGSTLVRLGRIVFDPAYECK